MRKIANFHVRISPMLVQTYFPQKLAPSRYDTFLASGWFRGSVMLYKMELLCLDGDLRSVVNIRLDLERYQRKKSHRKIVRKVEERFTVIYGKAKSDPKKEALYLNHKKRFKGFIHASLSDYLHSSLGHTVFDTREVCVYDGDRLIAVSFFDCGDKSMASLLGLYDDNYAAYSLGMYTMLKEIDFASRHGFRWFYPGYVLDIPSQFDYKLRLGDFEYYNANQRWTKYENFDPTETKGHFLQVKLTELERVLAASELPYESYLYPMFSMGYIGFWNAEFVKYPMFFTLAINEGQWIQLAYDFDLDCFVVNRIVVSPDHSHLINMEMSEEFSPENGYLMQLLMIGEHLLAVPLDDTKILTVFLDQFKQKWKRH